MKIFLERLRYACWFGFLGLCLQCAPVKKEPNREELETTSAPIPKPIPPAPQPQAPKTVVGITNCGNTCFMNSALQVLIHTPVIAQYFSQEKLTLTEHWFFPKEKDKVRKVVEAFHELYHAYTTTTEPYVHPGAILDLLPSLISGYRNEHRSQEDAQEYISKFLEMVTSATNTNPEKKHRELTDGEKNDFATTKANFQTSSEKSFVTDAFQGFYQKIIRCHVGRDHDLLSYKFDPMDLLSLSIPGKGHSLSQLIQLSQREIPVDLNENIKCQDSAQAKEGDTESLKIFSLAKKPAYLFIQLKRFEQLPDYSGYKKISTEVEIPTILPLQAVQDTAPRVFSLYAVILHHGAYGGGHYVALLQKEGKWLQANDQVISEMTEEKALELNKKNGYLFFYQEKSP